MINITREAFFNLIFEPTSVGLLIDFIATDYGVGMTLVYLNLTKNKMVTMNKALELDISS